MTGWSLFFIIVGTAFLTAQLFRLIDLIEHPRRRSQTAACRRSIPAAWNVRLWDTLNDAQWTFWKN